MPDGQQVDRGAADDLVGPQADREHGVHEREDAARRHADEQPRNHDPVMSAP